MTTAEGGTGEAISRLPYYYDADGNLPPWFSADGKFEPYKFDAEMEYKPKGETFELPGNPGFKIENPFDLRNLRIIDPKDVVRARDLLIDQSDERPSVCVIGTGGTIAMTKEGKSLVPRLDVQQLVEYTGRLADKDYQFVSFSFPTLIDSSQMKMDYDADIVIAMSYIWKTMDADSRRRFNGFLATHGTDTLSPSGTRIQMMLGSNLEFNVGLVGAQVNTQGRFSDVATNVGYAFDTLDLLRKSDIPTVFLQMGEGEGGAYNPAGTLKVSDSKKNAFESKAIDKIVDPSDTTKFYVDSPFGKRYKADKSAQDDVFQPIPMRGFLVSKEMEAKMDQRPSEIKKAIEQLNPEITALILKTYGSFTFDRQQYDAMMEGARDKGLLVFAANPFPTGHSDHEYADTQYVIEQGAIPLYMLSHAAEVKLKMAHAIYGTDNPEAVKAFITTNNFVGEQPKDWIPPLKSAPFAARSYGQPPESLIKRRLQPHDA